MNRKICAFIFLIFVLLSLQFVIAQNAPGFDEAPLVKEVTEGKAKFDDFSAEQNKAEYLTREWRTILSKNKWGQRLLGISDFIKIFDPLFKVILGTGYTLSWAFFLSVAIWLMLFLFFVNPISTAVNNRLIGIVISFILTSLIGVSGVIKKAVDFMATVVNNWWIASLSLVVALVIVFVFEKLGKVVSKYLKKLKEDAEKTQTKLDRRAISADAEISKERLEG
jgi:hypothetical protein